MKRDPQLPIKAETWEMIQRLVAFDTTSRESNLGLIEWVRDWLKGFGIESRLTYDADRRKANLFATIAKGARPGIVLSGHTDVVPVDGQPWDTDPFAATIKDDRIYAAGGVRHEELHRGRARDDAAFPRRRAQGAGAFRAVLRRGARLPRRARPDRGPGAERHHRGGLHRRRADRHAAGDREQGHAHVPLLRPRQGGAFRARPARRERDRVRGAAGRVHPRDRRPDAGHRGARPRLPRAVHDAPDRAHPRRHRAEHRAARLRVPLRVPLPAGRRPGGARARDQGLRAPTCSSRR